jgi:hypothetical protein
MNKVHSKIKDTIITITLLIHIASNKRITSYHVIFYTLLINIYSEIKRSNSKYQVIKLTECVVVSSRINGDSNVLV